MPMYYDLTYAISTKTIVFPGDPIPQIKSLCSLCNGDPFSSFLLSFQNHAGTHIDFPSHIIPNGKNSNDFSMDNFIGDCLIYEIPDEDCIDVNHLEQIDFNNIRMVFFKTKNSHRRLLQQEKFTRDFVYITPQTATVLAQKKIKMVGIDYLSLDPFDDNELKTHKILLGQNILIVESLDLTHIPAGKYFVVISPLKINDNLDALPARVIAFQDFILNESQEGR